MHHAHNFAQASMSKITGAVFFAQIPQMQNYLYKSKDATKIIFFLTSVLFYATPFVFHTFSLAVKLLILVHSWSLFFRNRYFVMSALPVRILKENAQEEKGEHARMSSFVGAIAIGDLVKSTLGPKGMVR